MNEKGQKKIKGKTNNPAGCPKGAHHQGRPKSDIREFFKELCDQHEIAEKLVVLATTSKNEDIRVKASVYLLDRAHGKAPQALEVGGKDGQPLTINLVRYG